MQATGSKTSRLTRSGAARAAPTRPTGSPAKPTPSKPKLGALVKQHRPELLHELGCGPLVVATLIGRTAGAERFATDAQFARQTGTAPIPASSGRRDRHRLHRGGDRQLNRALHMIAITRAGRDAETRRYLERKMTEGKTRKEAVRCLKRHLARRFHRLLTTSWAAPRETIHAVISVPCLT